MRLVAVLIVLGMIFWSLERLFPSLPHTRRTRREWLTDLCYAFFTPVVTKGFSKAVTLSLFIPIFLLLGWELRPPRGFGPVSRQPLWLQAVEILILGDFLGYWLHRLFHSKRLWKYHAVHHGSRKLDWLSALRVHPVNDAVNRALPALPFILAGFTPAAVAGYPPFLSVYALLLHTNVPWTFGPLRYVIASPAFHRWHHTREEEALDKNFSGLLPIWDLLFGTYHLPRGRFPSDFGVRDPVPEGFWGQLKYPWTKGASSTG